jgi:hypothetical protein
MLASITPFGERSRGSSWRVTAAAFAVGATGAGSLAGAALGSLGALVLPAAPGWRPVAALGVLAVMLAFDTALHGRLPSSRRQVNEDWLGRYRGWVYGAGFGGQLGVGVATIVTSATIYAVCALAVLAASPLAGGAIGGAFGLTRGASLLATRRAHDRRALAGLHRRLEALEAPVIRTTTALEAALLVLAVAWAAL